MIELLDSLPPYVVSLAALVVVAIILTANSSDPLGRGRLENRGLPQWRGNPPCPSCARANLFSVNGEIYHLHETQITGGRSRSEVGGTALA